MNNPQINQDFLLNPLLLKQDPGKQIKKIKISQPEVRIVYFGTPDFSALVLEKLVEFWQNSSGHLRGGRLNEEQHELPPTYTIQSVVTQPDKPIGRKQILTSSPVAQVAQKYNIPILKPEKLDADFIKNHLSLLDSDIFILAAFGKLLPQKLLDIPKYGALNIHPSLLPRYRGPSPIQNSILNGDKTSGVTIIKMDAKMDHGPVLITKEIPLSDKDTFESLSTKLFTEGAELLIEIIPDSITGKVKLKPQDDTEATFTHLIKKEDGYFDPPVGGQASQSFLEKLDRMIRAYYPWPNSWTKWNGKIVKFYPNGIVQMEGKKPMKIEEFLKGHPDFPIKNLYQ